MVGDLPCRGPLVEPLLSLPALKYCKLRATLHQQPLQPSRGKQESKQDMPSNSPTHTCYKSQTYLTPAEPSTYLYQPSNHLCPALNLAHHQPEVLLQSKPCSTFICHTQTNSPYQPGARTNQEPVEQTPTTPRSRGSYGSWEGPLKMTTTAHNPYRGLRTAPYS